MRTLARTGDENQISFAYRLRRLRLRFLGKQLCLSCAVGCTDAAVSLWESGKRVPQPRVLHRILDAFAHVGVSADELSHLRASWREARECQGYPHAQTFEPDSDARVA